MKLYYTRTQLLPQTTPFLFGCYLNYEEAVSSAHFTLKHCDVPCIDIVDQETDKIFITLHKLSKCQDMEEDQKHAIHA